MEGDYDTTATEMWLDRVHRSLTFKTNTSKTTTKSTTTVNNDVASKYVIKFTSKTLLYAVLILGVFMMLFVMMLSIKCCQNRRNAQALRTYELKKGRRKSKKHRHTEFMDDEERSEGIDDEEYSLPASEHKQQRRFSEDEKKSPKKEAVTSSIPTPSHEIAGVPSTYNQRRKNHALENQAIPAQEHANNTMEAPRGSIRTSLMAEQNLHQNLAEVSSNVPQQKGYSLEKQVLNQEHAEVKTEKGSKGSKESREIALRVTSHQDPSRTGSKEESRGSAEKKAKESAEIKSKERHKELTDDQRKDNFAKEVQNREHAEEDSEGESRESMEGLTENKPSSQESSDVLFSSR